MPSVDSLISAAWSAISPIPEDEVPQWFRAILKWHTHRLPSEIQEDFISLAIIELMQEMKGSEHCPYREDVQRALNRVRQRLLTEFGLTARSKFRKRESLPTDPASSIATSDLEAEANDIKDLLCEHLNGEQIVILNMLLEGRKESDIAAKLGKSTRTVQRTRARIAELISRLI